MFSKSSKYAIRSILFLAANSEKDQRFGARHLSESLDVPLHFLAKILQDLVKRDFLSSAKGPGGGFFLSEKNKSVTIADILSAVEGSGIFTECVLGFSTCSEQNPCPLHVQAYAYREGLRYQLSHITVEEMAIRINREQLKI